MDFLSGEGFFYLWGKCYIRGVFAGEFRKECSWGFPVLPPGIQKEKCKEARVLDDLYVKGGANTPTVSLHHGSGLLEISGMSMPEDPFLIYQPVLDWLEQYAQVPARRTVLSFRYQYYNTSTSKIVLLILHKLEDLYRAGHSVEVKWYYPSDNYDMEESGFEFSLGTILPFESVGE